MERKSVRYKLERYRWPDELLAQQKRKKLFVLAIVAILGAFVLGMVGGSYLIQSPISGNGELSQLEKIYSIMKHDWYFGKDMEDLDQTLIDSAISGMMQEDLDAHTYYMNKEDATQFIGSMSGSLTGIGASFYEINGDIIIEKTFPGSPARKAGILPGDIFYEVNDIAVQGLKSSELQKLVLGERGSVVRIVVDRQGEKVPFSITRDVIMTSIFGEVVDSHIGVLEINNVAETTATELASYLSDFKKQGVDRLVIDLRNNPGGYLSTLEKMGDLLFPMDSVIIQQEYRDGKVTQSKSKGNSPYTYDKIVVLINEHTASAGEALAAAMRELLGSTLVGTTTYGKGSVQIPKPFADGSVLKYTVAQWLTPNGNKINKVGIAPDVEVTLQQAYLYKDITLEREYHSDEVSSDIAAAQAILEFMQLKPGRIDGYFNGNTKLALEKFQAQVGLPSDGILDQDTLNRLIAANLKYWYDHRFVLDVQKIKAMELIRGE